jgi:hypothetical protein
MKNLISLLFLGLVIFAVVGWFQDWYSFGNVKNADGKTSVQFELDRSKIGADLSKGEDKLKKTIDGLKADDAKGASAAPKPSDPWRWN